MCKQITMNGSLKWYYIFVFVQVALCKAQYDDHIPPVFRLSTQPTSESFQQTEVKAETTATPGDDDLLTQLPLDTVTYPTPGVISSSEPVTNEQTSAQPQVSTIVSTVSTDGNEYLSPAPSYSTSTQSPVSTVLSPSTPGTSGYLAQQVSSTSMQLVGSNEETFSNSDSNAVLSEPAVNHQTSPQSPISMMMTSFLNPDGNGYLSQQVPSHLKTIQSQIPAAVPPPSAPGTSGSSSQQASSTSMPPVVPNTATFPTSGLNVVSSQPAMSHQLPSQSWVPSITSPFGSGYFPQQVPNYPNSVQSPTPRASSSPSASSTSDYLPPENSIHPTPIQPPVSAASPLSIPGTSGYYSPQQAPSYPTSLQSPYQPDMSGYSFSSPDFTAYATPASSISSYYPRQLAYPPMPYGNIPYYANSYYPMQYPMAYMNPQFPYMNPQMPYMSPQMPYMTPHIPYTGINPAYNQFLQPQPTNLNQTQSNRSQTPITQPPLNPQTAYAPAPNTADQSTPTVVSSTGENGSDLNSLPPQVKEFIDMIPNILSMQDTPQPASQPIHSIRHPPLRKYPKTATSSLLKKKQYYTYPQYSDYPRRYGYYF